MSKSPHCLHESRAQKGADLVFGYKKDTLPSARPGVFPGDCISIVLAEGSMKTASLSAE